MPSIGRTGAPVATTPSTTPSNTQPAAQPNATNPAWTPATRPGGATGGPSLINTRFAGDAQLASVLSGGTLTVGAKGEGVKKLQQAMTDMGFAVPNAADGSFGAQSAKAIKNFQVNASKMFPDVKATGVVDAATLRALDQLAPAAGQQGQSKNVPLPFFEGKPVRVVVLKDEHRTFLFDKQGKLEKILLNAVGAKATQTDVPASVGRITARSTTKSSPTDVETVYSMCVPR